VAAEVERALERGLLLEGHILQAGATVRESSKQAYPVALLDGRLILMSVLADLTIVAPEHPANPNVNISEIIGLLAAFVQGVPATETLISEGQYIKAAAALKQDVEILAQIANIRGGAAKAGKAPNVGILPPPAKRLYGQLNDIAHVSRPDVINEMLERLAVDGERAAVSFRPSLKANTAVAMYELHVWTLTEACQHFFRVLDYQPGAGLAAAGLRWRSATEMLCRAGHLYREAHPDTSDGTQT